MKPIYNKLFFALTTLLLIASCKKDEVKAVLQQPSSTTLIASATTLVLDSANKTNTAVTFSWPAFDYGYTADITYTLQFDSTAGNFAKPYEVLIGVNTLEKSYIVSDFNSLLSETLQLPTSVASNLLVPKNGDWGHKYALNAPDNTDPAYQSEGPFQPDAGSDIPAPDADGLYQIIVDFVKATYTVIPATPAAVPANLFIVGDATAGGWNNPVPVPSQQFTQISSAEFEITLPLTSGKSYLFLPVNGSWDHKYGGTEKLGGPLLSDNNVPGSNTPAPDESGTYKIDVNFLSKQYTVTKQ